MSGRLVKTITSAFLSNFLLLSVALAGHTTAYVLVGNVDGGSAVGTAYNRRVAKTTSDEAVSDYTKAGYTTVLKSAATTNDLLDALDTMKNPNVGAIWFIGHGAIDEQGNPLQMIQFKNGWIEDTDLSKNVNIQQVTLHACDQDLESWRALFPTAVANGEFDSWSTSVRLWQNYWWQLFATYPMAQDPPPPPVISPRLQPQTSIRDPATGFSYIDTSPVSNTTPEFTLNNVQDSYLEGRKFNFYTDTTDISGTRRTLLFSTGILNGAVDPNTESADPSASAAFDVSINGDAIKSLLQTPDLWPSLVNSSLVQLDDKTAGAVPRDVELGAIGTLIWGIPQDVRVPEPSTLLILSTGVIWLFCRGVGVRAAKS